jgi:2-polyprenyl-3-methyl-5-hydroxy-6-metoxy-1,4-benzoquinol methylase
MREKVEDQWNGSIYKNPSYTRLQRFFGKKIVDDYVSHSQVTEGTALDIGCGDGYLTSYASEKLGISFHGIDSSASMIDVAKLHETGAMKSAT